MSTFTNAISFFFDHLSLFASKTVEHLELTLAAVLVSIVVSVPLGLWLGHVHRGSFVAINLSNVGRAVPSLAIIAVGIALLGLGFFPTMVALVLLAAPIMLTNAYVAVDSVDRDTVDAACGMGMIGSEVLLRVELPLALPLTFAGIRTATVYVIATATLAAVTGGGGLGEIIVNQASYGAEGVVAGAIAVAVLALGAELILAAVQRALTPKGLRGPTGKQPAAGPPQTAVTNL